MRAVALLDSRVTIGAAAFAISRVLGTSPGYIIGSNISPGYCIDNSLAHRPS